MAEKDKPRHRQQQRQGTRTEETVRPARGASRASRPGTPPPPPAATGTARAVNILRTRAGFAGAAALVLLIFVVIYALVSGNSATPAAAPSATAGPLAGAVVSAQSPACTHYKTYGVPRVPALDPKRTYTAVFTTNKGLFKAQLLTKDAPSTVQSFIFLANNHYFDAVSFHRVVPGFVIQGGDPTGTGMCGPGYSFKDENLGKTYPRGALAMANSGANTNGSQFFVVLANATFLDKQPNYSLFGQVTSGLDAVDRIAKVRLAFSGQEQSKPIDKVYMKTVRIEVS